MLISLLVFPLGDLIHKSHMAPVGLFYLYSLKSSVCLKDIHIHDYIDIPLCNTYRYNHIYS